MARESDWEKVMLVEDSTSEYKDEDSLMGKLGQLERGVRSTLSSDQDLRQAREDLGEYSGYDDVEIRRATPEDLGKETEEIGKDETPDIVVDIDGGIDQSVMMWAAAQAGCTPVLDPDPNGETGTVFINGWRIDEGDDLVSLSGAYKGAHTSYDQPAKMRGTGDDHDGLSKRTEVMKKYCEGTEKFQDGPVPLPEVMEVSLPYKPEELDVPTYDAHNPEEALDQSEQSIEGDLTGASLDADYPDELGHLDDGGPTSTAGQRDDYRAVIRNQEQLTTVIDYLESQHPESSSAV
jgi:hypothetical protein